MFDINSEFIENITEEKLYIHDTTKPIQFPMQGDILSLDVEAVDSNNIYLIDINKKYATLERVTFQDRFRKSIVLLRLDIGNKPHTNPDGNTIGGNHIHVYCDGFNDSFAFALDDPILNEINPNFNLDDFKTKNHQELFEAFSDFCNISNFPAIEVSFL